MDIPPEDFPSSSSSSFYSGHRRSVWPSDRALDWTTDASQVTPDITCGPQIRCENVLDLSEIHGPEPAWSADRVPCPLNRADLRNFDYSFPHAAQELSPWGLRLEQPALRHPSGSEEATLARVGEPAIIHSIHAITPRESHSFRKLSPLSPSIHIGLSLSPQSVIPRLRHTRQVDGVECRWFDGIGPCNTVVEATESALMLHLNAAHAVHVRAEENHQDKKFPTGLSFTPDNSPPKHWRTCRAKREVVTATCEYAPHGVSDKEVPAALIADNPDEYNQDWSHWDTIALNGYLIDEMEVVCQWIDRGASCNDTVQGKALKAHLQLKHKITSDSQMYACHWHRCPVRPMKKSSLERHMVEQHIPVKWACPTCEKTFTRKQNLVNHFQRCPGRA